MTDPLASGIALLDLPHHRARALLSGGMPVYLCVDPVEYHGPHLSLHNDRWLSRGVVAALGQRLQARHDWPIVLADHLEVGVDPCPGPGSRPVGLATARAVVLDACRALRELGAQRVVLMTFHGAPLHNLAVEAGAAWLRRHGVAALAPFHLVLDALLMLDDPEEYADALDEVAEPQQRAAVAKRLPLDFHAGFFETSLSLHWAPWTVSPGHVDLPPCPTWTPDATMARAAALAATLGRDRLARELRFAAHGLGWQALRPFPGYTSRPAAASAAVGAVFARHILDLLQPVVEDVLLGRAAPPRPIMPWTGWSTGGGRWPAHPRLGAGDVMVPKLEE